MGVLVVEASCERVERAVAHTKAEPERRRATETTKAKATTPLYQTGGGRRDTPLSKFPKRRLFDRKVLWLAGERLLLAAQLSRAAAAATVPAARSCAGVQP